MATPEPCMFAMSEHLGAWSGVVKGAKPLGQPLGTHLEMHSGEKLSKCVSRWEQQPTRGSLLEPYGTVQDVSQPLTDTSFKTGRLQ